MANETVATYQHDGQTYEIDHLGVVAGEFDQWGEFSVFCGDRQVGCFAIPEAMLKPEFRPAELPATDDKLIALAKQAVAGDPDFCADCATAGQVEALSARYPLREG